VESFGRVNRLATLLLGSERADSTLPVSAFTRTLGFVEPLAATPMGVLGLDTP
jgi:hypothetical protein